MTKAGYEFLQIVTLQKRKSKMRRIEWTPELEGTLDATSFPKSLSIDFEDGSLIIFKHAFYKIEASHLVVYTEHCGYHVFLLHSISDYRSF